ncbi:MAG TPA: flagellar basal body-associated FliL family protein [Syntrophales bacterium]|nr:flagellar basal body-associated FliL family protein [Syntrophales bacterium]
MVRKVQLDLLDIAEEQVAGPPPKIEPDGAGTASRKWGLKSKILVAVSAVFLVTSIAVTVWFHSGKETARKTDAGRTDTVSAEGAEVLDHFAVDLRDDRGNYKVLVCSLALELNQGASIASSRTDIRRMIYRTLRAKSPAYLTAPKSKKMLKKEIEEKLEKLMGGKLVKHVYFTKFVLL